MQQGKLLEGILEALSMAGKVGTGSAGRSNGWSKGEPWEEGRWEEQAWPKGPKGHSRSQGSRLVVDWPWEEVRSRMQALGPERG